MYDVSNSCALMTGPNYGLTTEFPSSFKEDQQRKDNETVTPTAATLDDNENANIILP